MNQRLPHLSKRGISQKELKKLMVFFNQTGEVLTDYPSGKYFDISQEIIDILGCYLRPILDNEIPQAPIEIVHIKEICHQRYWPEITVISDEGWTKNPQQSYSDLMQFKEYFNSYMSSEGNSDLIYTINRDIIGILERIFRPILDNENTWDSVINIPTTKETPRARDLKKIRDWMIRASYHSGSYPALSRYLQKQHRSEEWVAEVFANSHPDLISLIEKEIREGRFTPEFTCPQVHRWNDLDKDFIPSDKMEKNARFV